LGALADKAIIYGSINERFQLPLILRRGSSIYVMYTIQPMLLWQVGLLNAEGGVGYAANRASKAGGENLLIKVIQPFAKLSNLQYYYTFAYLYEAEQIHTSTMLLLLH